MAAQWLSQLPLLFCLNSLTTPHLPLPPREPGWELLLQSPSPVWCFPDSLGRISQSSSVLPLHLVRISGIALVIRWRDRLAIFLFHQTMNSSRLCHLSIPSSMHCACHQLRIMTMYVRSGVQERRKKPRRSKMGKGNLFQMGNLDFQSFVQCGSLLS